MPGSPIVTRVAAAVCVAALTLVSCSSEGGGAEPADGGSTPGEATSVVEKLTGDKMCELLSTATIERELGVKVEQSEGKERGRAPVMQSPYFLSRECDYDTDELPGLNTDLTTQWDEDTSDQEVLDGVFTDRTEESTPVGDYEQVPGLGVIAGFGKNAVLSQGDIAASDLGVVLRIGDERLLLTVSATGKATLEQLRPLAEELVKNLEAALR